MPMFAVINFFEMSAFVQVVELVVFAQPIIKQIKMPKIKQVILELKKHSVSGVRSSGV